MLVDIVPLVKEAIRDAYLERLKTTSRDCDVIEDVKEVMREFVKEQIDAERMFEQCVEDAFPNIRDEVKDSADTYARKSVDDMDMDSIVAESISDMFHNRDLTYAIENEVEKIVGNELDSETVATYLETEIASRVDEIVNEVKKKVIAQVASKSFPDLPTVGFTSRLKWLLFGTR